MVVRYITRPSGHLILTPNSTLTFDSISTSTLLHFIELALI